MTAVVIVFLVAAVMIAIERLRFGRPWPEVRGWWLRAALLNGFQVSAIWVAGVGWNGWMVRHRPWSADWLGITGGAFVGYFVVTFFYYWWHRWRHEVNFLWRWFHQVHHSPQRIEIMTSFYKHPVEILVNSALSSAIFYLIVGLGPEAASVGTTFTGFGELIYHWNVPTPHWLGYIFQRPESHCVHHQEGVHTFNYSDLPLWDMLFGTYRNPQKWEGRCGFGEAHEHRLVEMLRGVDVNVTAGTPS